MEVEITFQNLSVLGRCVDELLKGDLEPFPKGVELSGEEAVLVYTQEFGEDVLPVVSKGFAVFGFVSGQIGVAGEDVLSEGGKRF